MSNRQNVLRTFEEHDAVRIFYTEQKLKEIDVNYHLLMLWYQLG